MKITSIIALLFLCVTIHAQSPIIEWQKCFGGSGNERPGRNIIQLSDSTYIIAGFTDSDDGNITGHHGNSGVQDIWLIKLDMLGNLIWQRCFGGSWHDGAISLIESFDGGIIMAGQSGSNDGDVAGNHSIFPNYDAWVVETDNSGNIQWQKCFGGTGDETAYDIIRTNDSCYVLAGWTFSNNGDVSGNHSQDTADAWILKINRVGSLIWQKCFGGTAEDRAHSIIQTLDGGFAILGETYSDNGDVIDNHDTTGSFSDAWIFKTDANGNLQWQNCLGGSNFETGESIVQDSEGNYIALINTNSIDGDVVGNHSFGYDSWIVKIDSVGARMASKCFGGTCYDFGYELFPFNMSSYLIAGSSCSVDGDVSGNHGTEFDYWVVCIDTSNNIVWQKCYGGFGLELMSSISPSKESGFMVTGYSLSNDGDVTGHHFPLTNGDFWIAKLSEPYVGISESKNQFIDLKCMIDQRENKLIINLMSMLDDQSELDLIDISGRIIFKIQIDVKSGLNHFELDPGELSQGIYLVRIMGKSGSISGKLIAN